MKLLDRITSGNKLLSERAERLVKIAKRKQESIINELEDQIDTAKDKVDVMLDFGPNSTTSLKPGKEFDAEGFMKDLQDHKVEISLLEAKLKIAKQTLEELF